MLQLHKHTACILKCGNPKGKGGFGAQLKGRGSGDQGDAEAAAADTEPVSRRCRGLRSKKEQPAGAKASKRMTRAQVKSRISWTLACLVLSVRYIKTPHQFWWQKLCKKRLESAGCSGSS